MKLLRYGPPGQEKPAVIDDQGRMRDLSGQVADITPAVLSPERLAQLSKFNLNDLPLLEGHRRIAAPVNGIGKILAIGLNYAEHVAEAGSELPPEPMVFSKAITSLSGPNDGITLPRGSTHTDYEVEIAAIIGSRAQYVDESEALDYIAGYAVMNDVSEREYQKERGGQFTKGKSFDGFGPLGPWLVTGDEIQDPQNLNLWTDVNGERRQDSNTRHMIFSIATIISTLSQYMTLLPGDVVTTGTPSGVGMGRTPPEYLKAGDVVEAGVEGLGQQRHEVKNWPGD